MIQFDDENIILCINCDAEYTITKYDGEEQEPEFCPFCGYHHAEEDDELEESSFDDDDEQYLN